MADKGGKSSEADPGLDLIKKWEDFEQSPEYQAYGEKYGEANAASSSGQLMRPEKPTESKKASVILGIRLSEAGQVDDATREVPVLIIKEGMGNQVDNHFYSRELLQKIAKMFEGVKAYADHPSKSEESDRPERSIKDIVGYYHSPKFVEVGGRGAISAILKINDGSSYDWAWDLVKEAVSYSGKFKDKDLVGISINAFGNSHPVEMKDQLVNVVDDLTEVQSADIVTQAGAGGGFRLREAVKKVLARENHTQGENMNKELLAQHGDALQKLRDAMKGNPEHEKAYGPTMEALLGHHAEMMKSCEGAPAPAPSEPPAAPAAAPAEGGAPAPEPKKDEPKKDEPKPKEEAASPEKEFEKMQERYQAGQMSATEKKVFEALLALKAEAKIKENVAMVEKTIKEAGLPEAYTQDLKVVCAGKEEAEVKKLVEARKALVAPLIGNRAEGAGAGSVSKPETGKVMEALVKAGVPLKK